MALAADGPPRRRQPPRDDEAMDRARTCYDHFAGRLGVGLPTGWQKRTVVFTDDGGFMTDGAVLPGELL